MPKKERKRKRQTHAKKFGNFNPFDPFLKVDVKPNVGVQNKLFKLEASIGNYKS